MSGPTGYIGSKLSLISKAEIRYEGILCSIDPVASTVTLAKVKSLGTEDRLTDRPSAPRDEIFEYIIFRGSDIKDIHVCDPMHIQQDPAIIRTGDSQPSTSTSAAVCFSPAYQQFTEYSNYSQYGNSNTLPSPSAGHTSVSQASSSAKSSIPSSGTKQAANSSQKNDTTQSSQSEDKKITKDFHSPNNKGPKPTQNTQSYNHNIPYQSKRETSFRDYTRADNYPRENYPRENYNYMDYNNRDYMRYRQARGVMNGLARGGINARLFRGADMYRGSRGMRGPMRGGVRNYRTQQKTPLKFDTEFDFEVENAKFDKTEIEEELKKLVISDDPAPKLANGEKEEGLTPEGEVWAPKLANGEKEEGVVPEGEEEEEGEEDEAEVWFYDKSKSFFDKISCEATERAKGRSTRIDWREERRTNAETFGVSAITRRGRRGRGGYRGFNYRGGNFRGRGANNSNYDPNRNNRGASTINRGNRRNQGWVDYDYNYEEAGINRKNVVTERS